MRLCTFRRKHAAEKNDVADRYCLVMALRENLIPVSAVDRNGLRTTVLPGNSPRLAGTPSKKIHAPMAEKELAGVEHPS